MAAWIAGVAWFVTCASLSYARFARHAAPLVVIQRGAVVLPPPVKREPAAGPASAPTRRSKPENLTRNHSLDPVTAQVDIPAPSAPTPTPIAPTFPPAPILSSASTRPAVAPFSAKAAASGFTPVPVRKTAAHQDGASRPADARSAEERPASGVAAPVARCIECGAPAASWVEVNGQRVGYCLAHYSRLDGSRGSRNGANAGAREPAPTQQETQADAGASVQCRGFTKDGTRCRRKTRNPSGFCYQHQPR